MTDFDSLLFDLSYALSKTGLVPKVRSKLAEDNALARQAAAREIVDHLKLCGWEIVRRDRLG